MTDLRYMLIALLSLAHVGEFTDVNLLCQTVRGNERKRELLSGT